MGAAPSCRGYLKECKIVVGDNPTERCHTMSPLRCRLGFAALRTRLQRHAAASTYAPTPSDLCRPQTRFRYTVVPLPPEVPRWCQLTPKWARAEAHVLGSLCNSDRLCTAYDTWDMLVMELEAKNAIRPPQHLA
ncbi:hypothetical protein NDU88_000202 [Pleurodeles waltl]|uniref:Uncharacterized protein n=1 Tax=Pleurodeles waltl TaxID=8319 RepID=A0AAV7P515_PLEWA|nr:hypothetical protein NDU88_000202 [Pleurodeles waltl]